MYNLYTTVNEFNITGFCESAWSIAVGEITNQYAQRLVQTSVLAIPLMMLRVAIQHSPIGIIKGDGVHHVPVAL